MKKFTFNLSFLDRFKKQNIAIDPKNLGSISEDSEFESDESPEEFAEKTLSGYKVMHDDLDNKNQEQNEGQEQYEEEIFEDNSAKDNFSKSKEVPKAPNKFSFKFPQFNRSKFQFPKSNLAPTNRFEKLNWNDFVLRIFSPYTRGKIHAIFIVLLVVVVTYIFGKSIALFFNRTPPIVKTNQPYMTTPPERLDSTLQDINKITSTNLFNAKESDKMLNKKPIKDIESIVCLDAERPTALQIKLLDTIVLQDSVKSVASVQVRGSSDLMNVREGERLDQMAEVSKINRMKVILKNLQTGDCEYAATESEEAPMMPNLKIVSPKIGKALFSSSNPSIKNSGNNFKIKKSFRDSMISNMSDILTQAKAVQITNPDGSLCFKMTEIVAGSLYSQLDIQENDIICNINGKKIENLNELMGLLGRIKEIDQFQIGMKRNGMNENKEYGFE